MPSYNGSCDLEVLENWTLNLDTWIDYNQNPEDEKVPFVKFEVYLCLGKLLLGNVQQIKIQLLLGLYLCLVEALSLTFYPSNYIQDMSIKWLCLHHLFSPSSSSSPSDKLSML